MSSRHFSAVLVQTIKAMTVETIMSFMENYGSFIIFALIFVEYLCIPGFPGGICIPAAGTISKMGDLNFFSAYFFGLIAAILSQTVLYLICTFFHGTVDKVCHKYKFLEKAYNRADSFIVKHGTVGLFIARIVPFARAFVSFPAGLAKMNFGTYVLCSTVGTGIYMLIMMSLGYFFAELFI